MDDADDQPSGVGTNGVVSLDGTEANEGDGKNGHQSQEDHASFVTQITPAQALIIDATAPHPYDQGDGVTETRRRITIAALGALGFRQRAGVATVASRLASADNRFKAGGVGH